MNTDDAITAISGRLHGLEIILEGLLATHIGDQYPDPVNDVEQVRQAIHASAQNVERPIDARTDEAWSSAVETIDRVFHNVRVRLERMSTR